MTNLEKIVFPEIPYLEETHDGREELADFYLARARCAVDKAKSDVAKARGLLNRKLS